MRAKFLWAAAVMFYTLEVSCSVIEVPNLKSSEYAKYKVITGAFNSEVPFCKSVHFLKRKFDLNVAIETGTEKGFTSQFLGYTFDVAHTFEINKTYIKMFKQRVNQPNIYLHPHDSGEYLGPLLETLPSDSRILFYLDAHWYVDSPLKKEFLQISKYFKDNCIILVDDIKVPGHDEIGYDAGYKNELETKNVLIKILKVLLRKCFQATRYIT